MEKLRLYLNDLTYAQRKYFADEVGTTLNYFRKAICLGQQFKPQLCVAIELATHGRVGRKDFYPNDYRSIWPELA